MTDPPQFVCPLTLAVMVDPVIDREGNSYERDAITQWLQRGRRGMAVSPVTRQPMTESDLTPNRALRDAIESWRAQNEAFPVDTRISPPVHPSNPPPPTPPEGPPRVHENLQPDPTPPNHNRRGRKLCSLVVDLLSGVCKLFSIVACFLQSAVCKLCSMVNSLDRRVQIFLVAAVIALAVVLGVVVFADDGNEDWIQVGSDVDGPNEYDWFGSLVSFSDDGTRFAVGAWRHDRDGLPLRGLVQVYEEEGGNWKQIGSDLLGDSSYDYFGNSVSMSGDGKRVAVGAPNYDDNVKGHSTGQIKVFEYKSGSWDLLGSTIVGKAAFDYSGRSVSLSYNGTIVAIGAGEIDDTSNGFDRGPVRVYEYSSDVWTQMGDDIDGEAVWDPSGWSVSLSDDGQTIAIGAYYNNGINRDDSGHTRVYKYKSEAWIQCGQHLDGDAEDDNSGLSVSLSADGNIVAVGTKFNDGVVNGKATGHVRIYEYISMTEMWSQLGDDIEGEAAGDDSGQSVSLSSDGTVVAIGADNNDGNGHRSGHVRIYKFDDKKWVQVGGDIDGESAYDNSGDEVSLSGDGNRVVIGAPFNDANGDDSGHVRVYERVGT